VQIKLTIGDGETWQKLEQKLPISRQDALIKKDVLPCKEKAPKNEMKIIC
jgi:hypothetical protein